MKLADATWTEVRDAEPVVALVPVGSTEQHGPHAPLGTDTFTARAVAHAAVDRFSNPDGDANTGDTDAQDTIDTEDATDTEHTGDREDATDATGRTDTDASETSVVVTPAVPVGVSAEHRSFDGTLWVEPDAFRGYVRGIAESLAEAGIDRIVFVNGHGGNTEALAELARDCSRSGVAYTVLFTWFDAVDVTDMGHGGPVETALLRHIRPEHVRENRVDAAAAEAADGWGEWLYGVNFAHDTVEFAPNGVVGDPRDGDADRGRALLETAADRLVAVVGRVRDRDLN